MGLRKPNDTTSIYVLKLVGAGLLLTAVSILAPQLPYILLRQLIKKKFGKNYSRKQISVSVRYLKRKKFIAFKKKNNKLALVITKLGSKHLSHTSLSDITIPVTAWDNQWRLLTFDIPEDHKSARHTFGRRLKKLGFFHFQRSVFILPYDCEKQIKKITHILDIDQYVHLITAKRFPSDRALTKKFKL